MVEHYGNEMYNKLFTKILDSSIWLAPDPHRIVWITLIAAMDEEGYAQFASVANLAHRARVSLEDAQSAVTAFESADPHDPTQEHEGRRIERVPGGWLVLNAAKYRDIVTREESKRANRERVARHRQRIRSNAPVITGNVPVMQSDTDTSKNVLPSSSNPDNSGFLVRADREPLKGVLQSLEAKKRMPF